jgi:hypothetical protein
MNIYKKLAYLLMAAIILFTLIDGVFLRWTLTLF